MDGVPSTFPFGNLTLQLHYAGATPTPLLLPESAQQRGIYFGIPGALLELVVSELGEDRLRGEDLDRDRQLAAINVDVGCWRGAVIQYPYLAPRAPVNLGESAASILQKTPVEIRRLQHELEARCAAIEGPMRGYLGWLLTQRAFLDEHDQLVSEFRVQLRSHGFPQPVWTSLRGLEATDATWVQRFREFYARWRLQSLRAPYLPLPEGPRIPDSLARVRVEGQVRTMVPDIFPTLGRGLIDDSLEDALRGGRLPEHLAGWMRIVRRQNQAKNVFEKWERIFRLQHYWKVLHQRYSQALRRKKTALIAAFAEFFDVSSDSIKNDLNAIARNLGAGWETRCASFD